MAISRTQAVSANAASVAIASATANDIIVVWAYSNTTTIPSLPAGFTSIVGTAGTQQAARLGWKKAVGGETSSGTWTNATQVACMVYRGQHATAPFGATPTITFGNSASLSYAAVAGITTGSWVLAFGGAKGATAGMNGTPTGTAPNLGNRTSQTTVNGLDTGTNITGFTAQTLAVTTSGRWATVTIELEVDPPPVRTATDAPAASESLARILAAQRTVTDARTTSESIGRTQNLQRVVTEGLSSSEAATVAIPISVTASESLSALFCVPDDFYPTSTVSTPMSGNPAGNGQIFISNGGVLATSIFKLRNHIGAVGTVVSKLYTVSAGIPGTLLATSDSLDVANIPAVESLVAFTFRGVNQVTLVNGTQYCITFEYVGGFGAAQLYYAVDFTFKRHAGNALAFSGGVWIASSNADTFFYVMVQEDEAHRSLGLLRPTVDSLLSVESVSRLTSLSRNGTESPATSEFAARIAATSRAITDALTLSDAAVVPNTRSASDALTAGGTPVVHAERHGIDLFADQMYGGYKEEDGTTFLSSGGKLLASEVLAYQYGGTTTTHARLYAVYWNGTHWIPFGDPLAESDPLVTTGSGSIYFHHVFSGANQYDMVAGTNYAIVFRYAGPSGSIAELLYTGGYAGGNGVQRPTPAGAWNGSGLVLDFAVFVAGADQATRILAAVRSPTDAPATAEAVAASRIFLRSPTDALAIAEAMTQVTNTSRIASDNPSVLPFLINEGFEGTGAPPGWSEFSGDGVLDWDYTAAPLVGSQSLRLSNFSEVGYVLNEAEVWMKFRFKLEAADPEETQNYVFWFYDAVENEYVEVDINVDGTFVLYGSAGSEEPSTIEGITIGVEYDLYFHARSDGFAEFSFVEAGGLRPTSGNRYVSVTDAILSEFGSLHLATYLDQISVFDDVQLAAFDLFVPVPEVIRILDAKRTVPDALTLAQSMARITTQLRSTTDALSILESVIKSSPKIRTAADAITASQSLARFITLIKTAADNPSIALSVTRALAVLRATSDSPSVAMSVARLATLLRTTIDHPIFSESLVRSITFLRTAADNPSTAHVVTRILALLRATAENPTISELSTALKIKLVSVSDSLSIAQAVNRSLGANRTTVESITLSEAASRIAQLLRSALDTLSIAEMAVGSKFGVVSRTANESLLSVETFSRLVSLLRTTTDAPTILELTSKSANNPRLTSDALSVSEIVARLTGPVRACADALSIAQSVARTLSTSRSASDNPAVLTAAARLLTALRAALDALNTSDLASQFITHQAFVRDSLDALTTSELATRILHASSNGTDALNLTQSVSQNGSRSRFTTDNLFSSDDALRSLLTGRLTVEDLIATDSASLGNLIVTRFGTDFLSVEDTINTPLLFRFIFEHLSTADFSLWAIPQVIKILVALELIQAIKIVTPQDLLMLQVLLVPDPIQTIDIALPEDQLIINVATDVSPVTIGTLVSNEH